jgi:hypothetical protein
MEFISSVPIGVRCIFPPPHRLHKPLVSTEGALPHESIRNRHRAPRWQGSHGAKAVSSIKDRRTVFGGENYVNEDDKSGLQPWENGVISSNPGRWPGLVSPRTFGAPV